MAGQNKTSDAQLKATRNYLKNTVEEIKVRIPKGYKEKIQSYARKHGQSTNDFICSVVCRECGLDYESKNQSN